MKIHHYMMAAMRVGGGSSSSSPPPPEELKTLLVLLFVPLLIIVFVHTIKKASPRSPPLPPPPQAWGPVGANGTDPSDGVCVPEGPPCAADDDACKVAHYNKVYGGVPPGPQGIRPCAADDEECQLADCIARNGVNSTDGILGPDIEDLIGSQGLEGSKSANGVDGVLGPRGMVKPPPPVHGREWVLTDTSAWRCFVAEGVCVPGGAFVVPVDAVNASWTWYRPRAQRIIVDGEGNFFVGQPLWSSPTAPPGPLKPSHIEFDPTAEPIKGGPFDDVTTITLELREEL